MKRREFLKTAGMSIAAITLNGCQFLRRDTQRRPNIIVIISDDMGYTDISCYGAKDIPTPNIDSIAQNGVRFTDGYVSAPTCSPSRAGLMTGRYQYRFGHEYNLGPPPRGLKIGLPLTETTMADVLADAGYTTGVVGKWHLGTAPRFHPLKRGFNEFFGFPHGGHTYLGPDPSYEYNSIMRGTTPVDEKEYLTDAFTREAVAFIKRHHDKPFFLWLAYNAPHAPIQTPIRYQKSFKHITKPQRHDYAGMIVAMDDGIGKVLETLRELGMEEDTLLFFLNDNGGAKMYGARNKPLRASKGTLWEGGIRVPFIVQWPRRLSSPRTYNHPVISLDILPTVAAAAGAKIHQNRIIDGVNLIPYLTAASDTPPHQFLFWRRFDYYAVRHRNWKLIYTGQDTELFDLASDIRETRNLAAEQPNIVKKLTKAYEAWNTQMIDPLWPLFKREPRPKEDNKNMVQRETGHYIQSGKTYTMTVKAKSLVGTGNRITLYCWRGFLNSKKLITSADFAITSSMEEKAISFDSDNYTGQRLIFGYKTTGLSPSDRVIVDKNVQLTYTERKLDPDPPTR